MKTAVLQPEYFHAAQVVGQEMASNGAYGPKEILLASGLFGNGDPIQALMQTNCCWAVLATTSSSAGAATTSCVGRTATMSTSTTRATGTTRSSISTGKASSSSITICSRAGLKKQNEAVYKSLDGHVTYQRAGSDLVVNGTLTIKDWQEGQLGIRLKDLPEDAQEPTEGASSRDYQYIHHSEQVGVDENGQPIFAPVFADFFDNDPNDTSDGRLVPPIGDEPNGINALGGNDHVSTGAGSDHINGGDGNDAINSGGGVDMLVGGAGNDSLNAGAGDDWLHGGTGTDSLASGDGDDHLFGEEENDGLAGGDGDDRLLGGEGDDQLDGGKGNDYLDVEEGTGRQRAQGGTGGDVAQQMRSDLESCILGYASR